MVRGQVPAVWTYICKCRKQRSSLPGPVQCTRSSYHALTRAGNTQDRYTCSVHVHASKRPDNVISTTDSDNLVVGCDRLKGLVVMRSGSNPVSMHTCGHLLAPQVRGHQLGLVAKLLRLQAGGARVCGGCLGGAGDGRERSRRQAAIGHPQALPAASTQRFLLPGKQHRDNTQSLMGIERSL